MRGTANYICIFLVVVGLVCDCYGTVRKIKAATNGYRSNIIMIFLRITAVISMVNIIMGFSSDTGQQSGSLSRRILSFVLNLIRGTKEITQEVILESENLLFYEKVLRKMAHMFEYGLLALLVWGYIFCLNKMSKKVANIAAIIAVICVGIADEINQTGVLERTGTYKDVLFDLAGAIMAIVILRVILNRYENRQTITENSV